MGHTKPEDLADLHEELAAIRALAGLKEKSPGIFFFKTIPFLHFHDKDGKRWVDVKVNGKFQRVEIDFGPGKKMRAEFLRQVREAHAGVSKPMPR